MAVKSKTIYECQACGEQASKWLGRCPGCQAWNTLEAQQQLKPAQVSDRYQGYAGAVSEPQRLCDVVIDETTRIATAYGELNRVLGGGLVVGSVVLVGGDPGVGKSTLLLQTVCHLAEKLSVLYVSGEESLAQISMRAKRANCPLDQTWVLPETCVERLLTHAKKQQPDCLVCDSIQTLYTDRVGSAPGSVSQVRESAMQLVQYAKQTNTTIFLVGHVTKEGMLAGPRVLEHMVDTVLYLEGERAGRLRLLRAVKNRFGAVNELGVFAMVEQGLREVRNPSAIFLSANQPDAPGCVVMVAWEGSRPIVAEVQALVDDSQQGQPRRVSIGLDQSRLALLLAVCHRHAGIFCHQHDLFVSVVGGLKIQETSADLPLVFAIVSSLKDRALPQKWVSFGEVGLTGEIRPVPQGMERLKEASKQGFTHAIVAKGNQPTQPIDGIKVFGVATLEDALQALESLPND